MSDTIPDSRRPVVAITGASSGIGRAAAARFARAGWRVGLIARSEDGLDAVRKDVIEAGGTASLAVADVADSKALDRAADHLEAELGPIDAWVNNAGVSVVGKFLDITEDEFRRVTDTNYVGLVNGTRSALKRMVPRDRGTIVQVLSLLSYRAVPLQSPYCGTKFAARGFTEALRSELISDNSRVHVTMVHPPAVNTPFYLHAQSHLTEAFRPPPPVYQPEIVADAIFLAATTRRREVKVSSVTVAGAATNKLLPGLLDYVLGKVGVQAQQTGQGGAYAERDSNLFGAPRKVRGSHGPYDSESRSFSVQMWASRNRGAVGIGLGLLGILAVAASTARAAPARRGLFGHW